MSIYDLDIAPIKALLSTPDIHGPFDVLAGLSSRVSELVRLLKPLLTSNTYN